MYQEYNSNTGFGHQEIATWNFSYSVNIFILYLVQAN